LAGAALAGAALAAPWLAGGVGAVLPPASAAVGAAEQPGVEAHILRLVNGERARSGLPLLTVDASMAAMALGHSQDMASADRIFHDAAKAGLLGRCSVVGENVGRGATGDIVHQAFMASPAHRSDVLGPYDRVGIGVAAGPTMLYVTEVFCESSAPAVKPPPAAPEPVRSTPAPKVTRPTPAPTRTTPAPVDAPPPAAEPPPEAEPGGMGSPCRLV
jgi:hypothetical protein